MKKLATIMLLCVLTGSFLFGALATAGEPPNHPNHHLVDKCFINPKLPWVCDTGTCRLYAPYTCPWGNILVWEGDFCC